MNLPNGWELVLILLVVVLVFGAKRLPDSARALGRSMRILKAETKGLHDDDTAAPATTAQVVQPVPAPQPVVAPQPVAPQPVVDVSKPADVSAQPYAGQQLFDASGRPVQVDVNGSVPVRPAQQASHPQA